MQALLIHHSPAELGLGLKIVLKPALQETSTHQSTSAPEMRPVAEEEGPNTGTSEPESQGLPAWDLHPAVHTRCPGREV